MIINYIFTFDDCLFLSLEWQSICQTYTNPRFYLLYWYNNSIVRSVPHYTTLVQTTSREIACTLHKSFDTHLILLERTDPGNLAARNNLSVRSKIDGSRGSNDERLTFGIPCSPTVESADDPDNSIASEAKTTRNFRASPKSQILSFRHSFTRTYPWHGDIDLSRNEFSHSLHIFHPCSRFSSDSTRSWMKSSSVSSKFTLESYGQTPATRECANGGVFTGGIDW